ncbi:unnamed protein product [Caenorhabditis bovis]|uniref:Uncharacterized protein n=1 Tax=Caenorhabditis bovis TaxID=2654633 RepID=A0A8S1FDN2_9PELO|nr:unnamed protein product [Caenorhabditis bovis]
MGFLRYSVVYTSTQEKIKNIRKPWVKAIIGIDLMIGWILFYNIGNIERIHNYFWSHTGGIARYLDAIISWIVSNPGGLKLNGPVNTTLSTFFGYHIYLWTAFVNLLQSEMFTRLIICSFSFGLSYMSAVVCDFAKIITLHFYCFDSYASRLWNLSYIVIQDLWALTRGKKWNPLRKRIDNVTLDSREQFLSTSLFVILLFILPTVLVYFVVFRTLRYCVSVIDISLSLLARWPLVFTKLVIKRD